MEQKQAGREFIKEQIGRLMDLYPPDKQSENFYRILAARIEANEFREDILVKTIDYVIDHVEPSWFSIPSVMKAKEIIEEYEANRYELHPALRDGY
jgi:hypothetical protein